MNNEITKESRINTRVLLHVRMDIGTRPKAGGLANIKRQLPYFANSKYSFCLKYHLFFSFLSQKKSAIYHTQATVNKLSKNAIHISLCCNLVTLHKNLHVP